MKQPLSGVIVDENGNPMPDVKVMIQGFDVEKITNAKGSFSFEIEAEKEQSVKVIAQKQEFETTHQYVSLGNTSVSLPMKKQ
ncbi:MAG: carboxypeptidase-like regulatory domain-containing protein [Desulfobacterales bacterium]